MYEIEEKLNNADVKDKDCLALAIEAHQKYILCSNKDDLQNAINYYIETIKQKPQISQTYYRLANLLYETGQITIQGAIEQCRQSVIMDPDNPDAHMYLGYFMALMGDKNCAKLEFKKAIKLKPLFSSRARIIMAITLLEDKNNIKFKNFIEAIYCLFSGSALFLLDRGGVKMLLKNIQNDLNYFKFRAKGKFFEKTKNDKKAYETYCTALDTSKNQAVFYEKMASIAIRKENLEVAHQCFQNALIVSNKGVEHIINAIEFVEKNFPQNYDELIDYYNELLKYNPEFSRCYYELGHLYFRKNEPLSALNAFKLALKYDENNPFYQNSLAFAYVQLEQYDEAIVLYKKALELNPDGDWSAVVAQALAAIYHQVKGNYDAAISMLQNALLLTNKRGQIYQAIADVYYDMANLDEALKYYKLALSDDDCDSKSYSRLAMVYWESDKIEDAISNYLKAIDLDPDYDIAYNNLGVVLLDGLGDFERSIPYFETAIDINADYVLAYFNLARAYEAQNSKIEAAKMYQKALDINRKTCEIDDSLIEEKLYKLFDI